MNRITGLRTVLKVHEKRCIKKTLRLFGWDVAWAAKALGVGQSTLYRKMQEHGIEKPKKLQEAPNE